MIAEGAEKSQQCHKYSFKDVRFDHRGAKLVSCTGRHPTSFGHCFLLNLHRLSKNCQLQDVIKEQYCQELMRSTFVNYLSSPSIRMRLLEKDELSIEVAFTLATTLGKAQKNAEVYNAASSVSFSRDVTACSSNQEASLGTSLLQVRVKWCHGRPQKFFQKGAKSTFCLSFSGCWRCNANGRTPKRKCSMLR